MPALSLYLEREQTLVKHIILKDYLQRFAQIVATFCKVITYVDCFSGPWNVRSKEMEDSSFALALAELRKGEGETPGTQLAVFLS
jgi:three-Cys-motif partner protein